MRNYFRIIGIIELLASIVLFGFCLVYTVYVGDPDFWDILTLIIIILFAPATGLAFIKLSTME